MSCCRKSWAGSIAETLPREKKNRNEQHVEAEALEESFFFTPTTVVCTRNGLIPSSPAALIDTTDCCHLLYQVQLQKKKKNMSKPRGSGKKWRRRKGWGRGCGKGKGEVKRGGEKKAREEEEEGEVVYNHQTCRSTNLMPVSKGPFSQSHRGKELCTCEASHSLLCRSRPVLSTVHVHQAVWQRTSGSMAESVSVLSPISG